MRMSIVTIGYTYTSIIHVYTYNTRIHVYTYNTRINSDYHRFDESA